jgi:hypothetical protein
MDEPNVVLTVTCPSCGKDALAQFPIMVVATALTQWNSMMLHGSCCVPSWEASSAEFQAIRDSLGEGWIQANRLRPAPPAPRADL